MSHPASQPGLVDCLFGTILGFMLPFYLAGSGGDVNVASAAILELIEAYSAATAAELDVVGRLLGFNAVAMDNLRLSMRSGLSDTKILQYRANAVALGRMADQCRKALEAMQTKREQYCETAGMPHPGSMPEPRPAPIAPPPQSPPPRDLPPSPPQASARSAMAVEGDPEFASDIETMKQNARAMLAELHAVARHLGPETPETSIAQMAMDPGRAIDPGNAAAP